MLFMDVDSAVTVPVNAMPLISNSDFKTRQESIAYNESNMDLVWNFATTAGVLTQTAVVPTSGGVHDWSHIGEGMYKLALPSTGGTVNNDAEGVGYFTGECDGVLPWRGPDVVFRAGGLNDLLIDEPYQQGTVIGGTGASGGSLSYDSLRREVGRFLAIGEEPSQWDGGDVVRVDDIIRRGMRRFYFPEPSVLGDSALVGHNWSFIIDDLYLSLSSAATYHTLPASFIRMVGKPTIVGGEYPLEEVTERDFRNLLNVGSGIGKPQYYTIKRSTPRTSDLAYKVGLYPIPLSGLTLEGQYVFDPPAPSSSQDPVVTAPHVETLISSVLATADESMNYETYSGGGHMERFKTLLASSILYDKSIGGQ
jgi:hypothetical protein